jgi:L-iditol 2-dehydrogenase
MKAIVSDVNENRLNFAEKCGADFLIDASKENVPQKIKDFTNDVGSNIVIVTAPGKLPSIQAIQSVAKLGMVVFFASNYPSIKIPIDLSLLHYREITLTGSEGRTEKDFLKATYFLNSKAINVKPLISGKVDLTKIEEGFKRALDPSTYRIIVEFG